MLFNYANYKEKAKERSTVHRCERKNLDLIGIEAIYSILKLNLSLWLFYFYLINVIIKSNLKLDFHYNYYTVI